ncbi:unnamed protein product [Brugia pahangi]|uniref:C-type lectin domain-containing protein n=1 Tax=Brugia pahangi TaxID=6280 RepID=A0A0N4TPJ4_BRUPA|nr:unnamed protein product [Brugia pahangi]
MKFFLLKFYISEYPEYAEGLLGALFGLFFIRQNGFVNNDSTGMYGGKMIWYDGTLAKTDFSSFYDSSFNPRLNKSNCYRFMTWAIEDNDCNPKRCALGDHQWKRANGEIYCFSIVYKISNHTEQLYSIDDTLCAIQRQRKHIAMYPAIFQDKNEYQFIMQKIQHDLKIDQPMFYRYHFVLFGLWYFRGAGYRWSDFSQNFNFEFIDPNFNPQLNRSQCYRFLAIPFGNNKYAIPMECSMQPNVLSVLCMYKTDEYYSESRSSKITTFDEEDDGFIIELMNMKLLTESISKGKGN